MKKDKHDEVPVAAVTAVLKSRESCAAKTTRLISKECEAQVYFLYSAAIHNSPKSLYQRKDADAAAGVKSAGCCGGSTSHTHDPSNSPSEVPASDNASSPQVETMLSAGGSRDSEKDDNPPNPKKKLARGIKSIIVLI